MSDGVTVTVIGIADYTAILRDIPHRLRRKAILNALKAGARVVQKAARDATPIMSQAEALKAPYRKPGTVRGAISVRTSSAATAVGDVGVFVNVRPAKGGNVGAKNPNDPFYWRFLEFGTKNMPAVRFLDYGAAQLSTALSVFEQTLGPEIQRLDTNPSDQL